MKIEYTERNTRKKIFFDVFCLQIKYVYFFIKMKRSLLFEIKYICCILVYICRIYINEFFYDKKQVFLSHTIFFNQRFILHALNLFDSHIFYFCLISRILTHFGLSRLTILFSFSACRHFKYGCLQHQCPMSG